MQRGDSIDHEAEKQSRYVTFSSTCYVYTSITHTLCVSQSQYYNTYLKQYCINSYLLIIYSCDSNYNSEKASTLKKSIIREASLVVSLKEHAEVSLYAPLPRVEEKREKREERESNVA